MSDVSRSCARCRRVAVVARGNAAYCLECNTLMDWAEIIAIAQRTQEPAIGSGATGDVTPSESSIPAAATQVGPAAEPAGAAPDPFARRLI